MVAGKDANKLGQGQDTQPYVAKNFHQFLSEKGLGVNTRTLQNGIVVCLLDVVLVLWFCWGVRLF